MKGRVCYCMQTGLSPGDQSPRRGNGGEARREGERGQRERGGRGRGGREGRVRERGEGGECEGERLLVYTVYKQG